MKKILTLLLLSTVSTHGFALYNRQVFKISGTFETYTFTNLWVSNTQPSGNYAVVTSVAGVTTYWSTASLGTASSHLATGTDWALIMPTTWTLNPIDGSYYSTITSLINNIGLFNTNIFLDGSLTSISYRGTTGTTTYRFVNTYLDNVQFTEQVLSVYPNPTLSILNIDTEQEFLATLYDLSGKKLLNFSTKTIDISQLTSGIYILDIISEDKRYTKKIIKK